MKTLRPIADVAQELGLAPDHVIPWGRHRAKVARGAFDKAPGKGRLILVSAITPTPAGEGKTTMSIALSMGLRRRGRNAVAALREPSLGPVFGLKGGATGGGKCTLEPATDINLHATSDFHAVTAAHNLLAAVVDNALHFGAPVEIDPLSVRWRRVIDMNDRSLRRVVLGLGGKANGVPRESAFDITAASEVMAVLGLSSGLRDLEARLARVVVGQRRDKSAVRAGELDVVGAMTALLRDAVLPNLVQTAEGGPAFVHGGPFANIAHGCSTLLATRLGLAYADEVVTEAGFGFDLGGEKFLDIKCREGGLWPRMVVLVATLRALKLHGGAKLAEVEAPNAQALSRGFEHLSRHLSSIAFFGLPAVVVINRFPSDTDAEVEALRAFCRERGVEVALCDGFGRGGEGALEFADKVLEVLGKTDAQPPAPKYAYPLEASLEDKITAVAKNVYGADGVVFTPGARKDLDAARAFGGGALPVCMAKTHLSLTDDPTKQGSPKGFEITVREARLSAGAGFVVALTGEIVTMPGLPKVPAAKRIGVDDDGNVTGL